MLKFAPNFFLSLLLSKTLVWSSLRAFEVYLYFSEGMLRPAIQEMKKTLEEGSIKNLNIWLFAKRKKAQNNYTWDGLSILKDPTFSTHNNPLIHLSTPNNLSYWWSFSSLVSILLCDNAQLISNRRWNKPEAYWSFQYLHSCMSMFIEDSIQKTPMTMVNC